MQEMMKQMESLADNGDFQNMLEGMMGQLMSKDLLYEPMKDLAAKVSYITYFFPQRIIPV